MKGTATGGLGGMIVILAFACLAIFFLTTDWSGVGRPAPVAGAETPIVMLQPKGFPEADNQNSDTNVNNAQAEVLRAQADQIRAEADRTRITSPAEADKLYAEAERLRAEACQIRSDCGLFNYKDGVETGKQQGVFGTLALIVVVILLFALAVMVLGRR